MNNYIKKQLEMSEQMFLLMKKDHEERTKQDHIWVELSDSLMKKLKERDEEIAQLKAMIAELKHLKAQ
jgi:hypothetical protein